MKDIRKVTAINFVHSGRDSDGNHCIWHKYAELCKLNLLIWFVGVGVTVYFLYYEDADRPIRRITECEVLVLCMSVCETLGVLLLHCFCRFVEYQILMLSCNIVWK